MKLWNWKSGGGLAFVVLYAVNALALPMNESTGQRPLLIPGTEGTVFSFIFLLVLLFTISHFGSWVVWRFRHRGEAPGEVPTESKRTKRKRR